MNLGAERKEKSVISVMLNCVSSGGYKKVNDGASEILWKSVDKLSIHRINNYNAILTNTTRHDIKR